MRMHVRYRVSDWTVDKTTDEFGSTRYFICDMQGNWVGNACATADEAFERIAEWREESQQAHWERRTERRD